MIKIEHIETFGFKGALRGMRNPMNSWGRADTLFDSCGNVKMLGLNDANLMINLRKAGTDHRKYLRMFHVQMDITAPLYWWKDFDTYKVGTVANSCSTMHKIQEKKFVPGDFAHEHLDDCGMNLLQTTIDYLNYYRDVYNDCNKTDKDAWYRMIQMLPSSYMQRRTVDVTYEVLLNLYNARKNHRLYEFREICSKIMEDVAYLEWLFYMRQPNLKIGDKLICNYTNHPIYAYHEIVTLEKISEKHGTYKLEGYDIWTDLSGLSRYAENEIHDFREGISGRDVL